MKLPRRIVLVTLLASLAAMLAAVGPVAAAPHQGKKRIAPPAKVKVGRVELGRSPYLGGQDDLLVSVRYPIAADGRMMLGRVLIDVPGVTRWGTPISTRVSAGALRRPERRRVFTFTKEVGLPPQFARALKAALSAGRKAIVRVHVDGRIDVDHDGVAELESHASARRVLRPTPRRDAASRPTPGTATQARCADFPVAILDPGSEAGLPLPACTSPVHWRIRGRPAGVSAKVVGDELEIKAGTTRGEGVVRLNHGTAALRVTEETGKTIGGHGAAQPVVRAMGDSVTAGFGYYSDGSSMGIGSLYECKPVGTVLDDACSSNSTATKNGLTEVPYAPDYGLANNVSWAAQWANDYGVTNYKNYAVSGSEPGNWAPGGNLYATTQRIEAEDPDYILMTIGANPILADTLFGLGSTACALESDVTGGYKVCVEEEFEEVHLRRELKSLYANLVERTQATIYLMQYHLAIPSSALFYSVTQIAEMGKLMNETIAAVAAEVSPTRLRVIAPPHFDVGVSLEPVYPASYSCSSFGFTVDGPSVQSTPTQDELEAVHYLSFCGGPQGGGEPWVISGDTGIHPSAAGYREMASQVPPPGPGA